MAAADHRDRADVLDFPAGRGAAAAQDARLTVEDEEALGLVNREMMMRRVARRGQRVPAGRLAHLSEPIAVSPGGEHGPSQIEDSLACFHGVGMLRLDDHAVAGGEVAGGGEAALAFHVDKTGAAGAERQAVGILAQLGQRKAEAVHGVQHRGARGNLDECAVDRK
ncbi:MAG TPA: hypothetical protein VIJ73_18945, partial [Methylomirabilota bacterium]